MRDDSPLWISQWRSAVCNRHWSHTKGKVQSQPPVIWPCCNLIIWEHRGKLALDISYLVSVMCTEHTQTPSLSQPHTDGKVLSQHPQIRLHVAFPIRGFLERLNPRVPWYSSLQSRAQVDIPVHGLWALISRRICHADPRFPQDQRPSCEHGNDSQLQMWHTHASLCTHSHMWSVSRTHTHTSQHGCPETDFSRLKSSKWSEQTPRHPTPNISLFSSKTRGHLSEDAQFTIRPILTETETEWEQMNTERANKDSKKSKKRRPLMEIRLIKSTSSFKCPSPHFVSTHLNIN